MNEVAKKLADLDAAVPKGRLRYTGEGIYIQAPLTRGFVPWDPAEDEIERWIGAVNAMPALIKVAKQAAAVVREMERVRKSAEDFPCNMSLEINSLEAAIARLVEGKR